MSNIINERPGVYSSYQLANALSGNINGGVVAIAARSQSGEINKIVDLHSHAECIANFGSSGSMTAMSELLFKNGASKLIAISVANGNSGGDYVAAFNLLMRRDEPKFLVSDSRDLVTHTALSVAILGAQTENAKYRIGIAEASGDITTLVEHAADLNSERIVLCAAPDPNATHGAAAACLAGLCASVTDPALPLSSSVLTGLNVPELVYSDSEINTLVQGGVTPIESVGGQCLLVRAVTTKSQTGGTPDATWRELSTILIVDKIIPEIRNTLKLNFARVKNTAQTRGAIRTKVVIELENYLANEIITGYRDVSVSEHDSDPTVCLVSFGFDVAYGLNSISLMAYITV